MRKEPARSFEVPDIVRRRALTEGAESEAWLDGIDSLVESLANAWQLTLGRVRSGGSEALVVDALMEGGREAVLKVGLPSSGTGRHEANVLAAANGRGYAKLFEFDHERRAMLLERLGSPLAELHLPESRQMEIICETLHEAWQTPPGGCTSMDGAEKAESLSEFIVETWDATGRLCSDRVLERALGYARQRREAFSTRTAVLTHGDCHESNTLRIPGTGGQRFKFIDPDGLFIEPAYDLGVLMRGWGKSLLAGDAWALGRERANMLAARTEVDAQPIWEWGFIERVSTGLVLGQLGQETESAEFLAVAELWEQGDASMG